MNFFDLDIDTSVKTELINLSKTHRLPHAVIIEGSTADKRTSLAWLLASWAVCQNDDDVRPCGTCPNCVKAMAHAHSDIKVAQGSGKTDTISVNEIRNITRDSVIIPNDANVKVYLIFEADSRMQAVSQNAFLKTLEEPPKNVMFIITAQKSDSLLLTIRSRSTVFSLSSDFKVNQDTLEISKEIACGIIQTREMPLLIALGKLTNKQTAKDVLQCVSSILRDALAISCGSNAITDYDTANKISLKLTKSKIIQLIDFISESLIKIETNINMNLMTTWLCGELRRIAWQR